MLAPLLMGMNVSIRGCVWDLMLMVTKLPQRAWLGSVMSRIFYALDSSLGLSFFFEVWIKFRNKLIWVVYFKIKTYWNIYLFVSEDDPKMHYNDAYKLRCLFKYMFGLVLIYILKHTCKYLNIQAKFVIQKYSKLNIQSKILNMIGVSMY